MMQCRQSVSAEEAEEDPGQDPGAVAGVQVRAGWGGGSSVSSAETHVHCHPGEPLPHLWVGCGPAGIHTVPGHTCCFC